jgi:hypothetical protein
MNSKLKKTLTAGGFVLLLAAAVYGWRAYSYGNKVKQLQAQAAEAFAQANAPGAASGPGGRGGFRSEQFREVRAQVESLPEYYQQQFQQSMGNMFMRREEQRLDNYFKMSKAEKQKYLDKQIAEAEKRRMEIEARRARATANASVGNGSGDANRGPGGGNRGGWGGRGGGMSARLDRTSPAMRAKMSEYRRDMEARRAQLNLPSRRG